MSKKVLIGCECSGTVRDAFTALGFDAWSCDLKPDERGSNRHMVADVREVLAAPAIWGRFDLLAVFHPPCTRLCNSGVRWLKVPPPGRTLADMWQELREGAQLFSDCLNSYPELVAVENPVMHKHAKALIDFNGAKPQFVQPWQFATDPNGPDNEKKRTGFWKRALPDLIPTGTLDGSTARNSVHFASPGENRATERSRFFPGIAAAIAAQWGACI